MQFDWSYVTLHLINQCVAYFTDAHAAFVSLIRHLHDKNVSKLTGLEDQWMTRSNASKNAVSKQSND